MLLHGHTQQRRARAATTCRRASQPTENAVIHKPEEVPRAIRDEYEAPREFAATELLLHHLLSVICASTKLSNIVSSRGSSSTQFSWSRPCSAILRRPATLQLGTVARTPRPDFHLPQCRLPLIASHLCSVLSDLWAFTEPGSSRSGCIF